MKSGAGIFLLNFFEFDLSRAQELGSAIREVACHIVHQKSLQNAVFEADMEVQLFMASLLAVT